MDIKDQSNEKKMAEDRINGNKLFRELESMTSVPHPTLDYGATYTAVKTLTSPHAARTFITGVRH